MQTTTADGRARDEIVLDGRQVCIVDDDELFRAHVGVLLARQKIRVVEAGGTAELEEILDRRMPDCILLDYDLASENGLFVLEQLKRHHADLAPIVMLSADETQRTAVRAFRAGASDYVAKRSLRLEELTAAVRRALGLRLREETREQEIERLRRNAHFDEPTGLLMRSALDERLALALDTARRVGRSCALVGFRLARFGEAQDRFGLAAADRILRVFGRRLREFGRSTDLCGVWDRGTFVFLVDADTSPKALASFARRILENATVEIDLAAAHLSLSAVSARVVGPEDGETPTALAAALDRSLDAETRAFCEQTAAAADWVRLPETSQPAEGGQERRRSPRMRTLKQGRIYLDELHSTIDCTVRNLSPEGAGLRLMGPTAIPEFFRLRISDSGLVRKVRKRWHLNNDLGVEFLPE